MARADLTALVLSVAFAGCIALWNLFVGLTFTPGQRILLVTPTVMLTIALAYIRWRPHQTKIIEILLYFALWQVFPVFATELTYLANTWAFPIRDQWFGQMDAAMGFDWKAWVAMQNSVPILGDIERAIYPSHPQLIFANVLLLALAGPVGGNARLLVSMIVAMAFTAAGSGLWPSYGPAELNHIANPWSAITSALRAGGHGPFPYVGIVTFPSFHATMAALLILANLEIRWRLLTFGVLNALMIFAIPYAGGHFLTDVIAGVAIAALSYWAAGRILVASYGMRVIRRAQPLRT